MIPADFNDVAMAGNQGTIISFELFVTMHGSGGVTNKGFARKFSFDGVELEQEISTALITMFVASVLFFASVLIFYIRLRKEEKQASALNTPLVTNEGIMA